MEYCDGGDLFSMISKQRGKPLHEDLILFIFLQLCLAVNYIHGRHILHRDIKEGLRSRIRKFTRLCLVKDSINHDLSHF